MISKLTTQEFIDKLRKAPQWTLSTSPMNEGLFELRVVEDDEVKTYLSPDPMDLSDLGHRMFLASLRKAAGEDTEEPMRIPVVNPGDIKEVYHTWERAVNQVWRHNDGERRWELGRTYGFAEQWSCDAYVLDEVITDAADPADVARLLQERLGSVPPPFQKYLA
jgi:hypothetical protein